MSSSHHFQSILINARERIQLNNKEEHHFIALLKAVEIRKKDFLLRQTERCDKIYFVNSGLLRS